MGKILSFSKQELKDIKRMFFYQKTKKEISNKYNVSESSVGKIIWQNNLVEKRERYYRFLIYIYYKRKLNINDLSEKTGIKYSSFSYIKRKYNIKTVKNTPPNKLLISKKDIKKIRNLFFKQKTLKEIAKEINVSVSVINRIINENNFKTKRDKYYLFLINYAYRNGKTIEEISKEKDIMYTTLCRIKKENNIKTVKNSPPNKRITEEIKNKMITDYKSGMSCREVSEKYGFKTKKTTEDVLKKFNIKTRTKTESTKHNHNYFKEIDHQNKAYIIGLLLSDGYVFKDYRGIGIDLKYDDCKILKKIKDIISPENNIKFYNYKRSDIINGKTVDTPHNMSRLVVCSPVISNDLKKYGIIKNKTYELKKFPDIHKSLWMPCFRGLIDGDGSIGVGKNNFPWCKLVNFNKIFLESCKEKVKELGYSCKIYDNKNNLPSLYFGSGKNEILTFIKKIYENKELYLERKYEKIKNYIN